LFNNHNTAFLQEAYAFFERAVEQNALRTFVLRHACNGVAVRTSLTGVLGLQRVWAYLTELGNNMTYKKVTSYDGEYGYVGEDFDDKHQAIKLGKDTYLVSGTAIAGADFGQVEIAYKVIRDDITMGTALANSTRNAKVLDELSRVLRDPSFKD